MEITLKDHQKPISVLGISDSIIVTSNDVILVAAKESLSSFKDFYNQIKLKNNELTKNSLTVNRPWGSYSVLDHGDNFKIKKITVKPMSKLSLQLHSHRSEHWVVVQGTATVINGGKKYIVKTNQSTFIKAKSKHRLENNTLKDLILIEVQTGEILDENDIERFSDIYGRIKKK